MADQDRDDLDHPDSLAEDPDDEETQALRPLFPDGVPDKAKADEWKALFGGA